MVLPAPRGAHRRGDWTAGGVSRHRLEQDLGRPAHHGRWAWRMCDPGDPVQRALQDASVVPADGALGGWGAAQLLGVTWLDGTAPDGSHLPSLVCAPPSRRVRRPGVAVLRSRLPPGDVVRVVGHDVRVTSPARTAFDLARRAADVATAVTALDAMLAHGLVADDVLALARERPSWRGARRCVRALALASGRVRSPGESRFRAAWLAAGLPLPAVNATVVVDGRAVAEVDLLDDGSALVGEYDGAPHAGALARTQDARRQERLERLGLVVVRVTAADLAEPAALRRRLLQARARADDVVGVRRWSVVQQPLQVGRLLAYDVLAAP